MKERWILQGKKADFNKISRECGIPAVLARVLVNRDISTKDEIRTYLNVDLSELHSPWKMRGMQEAVDMILEEKTGKVAIASDFDCDGIFSAYILSKGLGALGIKSQIYTPDRIREGYGLNQRIIEEASRDGATMILTCDNGIAAKEEVLMAKRKGLRVIVTDHHEVQGDIPGADAVIDPKQKLCEYPYKNLCGAGVAYKLIQALIERECLDEDIYTYLPYVAIATVADVMDLTGENRIIVKEGLERLQSTDNLGLQALMQQQEIWDKELKAYHLGYILGPCFNASGRLETVEDAFLLLRAGDQKTAQEAAKHLKELNDVRKDMTKEETEKAFQILSDDIEEQPPVIVLCLEKCHESLVGIIAGRIREKYYRPVIVFTETEDGMLKGSGRSIPAYDMFAKLYQNKELMERFGGHPMAAGMTIRKENFGELKKRLCEQAELSKEMLCPEVWIDADMPIHYITENIITELDRLEPVGKGNPKPIFARSHFKIWRTIKRGKNDSVIIMNVSEVGRNERMDAVLFGQTEEFEAFICNEFGEETLRKMYRGEENSADVAFAYYPSINSYHGYNTIQIQVCHYCRING